MNIEAEAYIYEIPWEGDKVFDEFLKMEYIRSNIPQNLKKIIKKYKVADEDLNIFNTPPSYFKRPFYIEGEKSLLPLTKLSENCTLFDLKRGVPVIYTLKRYISTENLRDIKLTHSLISAVGFSSLDRRGKNLVYCYDGTFELHCHPLAFILVNLHTKKEYIVNGVAELQSIIQKFNPMILQ